VKSDPADLAVDWFSESNVRAWQELFGETFGVHLEEGYFLWKYTRHPLAFTASTVASANGRLVGALGSVPRKFNVGGRTLIGTHELDMMVRKGQRNMGVFFKLFKFRLSNPPGKEVSLSVGMNDRVLRAFAERFLGYRDVDSVPEHKRILDTSAFLDQKFGDRLVIKLLGPLLFLAFRALDLVTHVRNLFAGYGYRVREITRFDERFDGLWDEVSKTVRAATLRDSSYLNWRYTEDPARSFEILSAEDKSGRLAGFVVFAALPAPVETGVILELVTRPGSPGVAHLLAARALGRLKELGSKSAAVWAFRHQENVDVLKRMGFREREQDLNLQVRKIAPDLDWSELTDRSGWYISMGDNDFYYGCPI